MITTAEQRKEQADRRMELRCSAERFANGRRGRAFYGAFERDIDHGRVHRVFNMKGVGDGLYIA
jgi:hypothetical protein